MHTRIIPPRNSPLIVRGAFLTLVTKNVPRFPWSLLRFHTPSTLLITSSSGSMMRFLSLMMAPRSFKSRYSLVVS